MGLHLQRALSWVISNSVRFSVSFRVLWVLVGNSPPEISYDLISPGSYLFKFIANFICCCCSAWHSFVQVRQRFWAHLKIVEKNVYSSLIEMVSGATELGSTVGSPFLRLNFWCQTINDAQSWYLFGLTLDLVANYDACLTKVQGNVLIWYLML